MFHKTCLFSLYKFTGKIIAPVKSSPFTHLSILFRLTCILMILSAGLCLPAANRGFIPISGDPQANVAAYTSPNQTLDRFIEQVANGDADALVGVYSTYKFAYKIVGQPVDQPAWIDEHDNILTRFSLATDAGSIGLLAHYEHAGQAFYSLEVDDLVTLVYGNGKTHPYRVKDILYYKALEPENGSTSFISLADQREYSQKEVFDQVYGRPENLVLQTCLVGDSISTWGRMFVIAEEVPPSPPV